MHMHTHMHMHMHMQVSLRTLVGFGWGSSWAMFSETVGNALWGRWAPLSTVSVFA